MSYGSISVFVSTGLFHHPRSITRSDHIRRNRDERPARHTGRLAWIILGAWNHTKNLYGAHPASARNPANPHKTHLTDARNPAEQHASHLAGIRDPSNRSVRINHILRARNVARTLFSAET
ncbi:hypothetical protein GCM10022252_53510 [Streptosporangium oxazolinicum]|uniref:Uncharacterized protein n=1 Tax=Streptosporangium oxazolinicum TaxID=909287 RepID=A0ABP8B8F8_9ACTN